MDTVTVELTTAEAALLANSMRDIQKAIAWESDDDEALSSIESKCRRALRKR
jgi:hypothetical protein